MKAKILLFSLVIAAITNAQRSGVYAVTDTRAGGVGWFNISEVLPEGGDIRFVMKGQEFKGSKIELDSKAKSHVALSGTVESTDLPFHSGIAALAYDRTHDRLYFSTMLSCDLRFINLKDGNSFYQVGKVYDVLPLPNTATIGPNNQGPVITRMTMGADGYIYGLSNNSDAFFRVSTRAKMPVIENLGNLIDDPANGDISIRTACSSWGGDMIASADGSLFVFSMYKHVFKINPSNRVATHLGVIEGLPAEFTINGAAVQDDGSVILSSAAVSAQYALIPDPSNLLSVTLKQNNDWYNTSDLASGNVLFAKKDPVFGEFDRSAASSGVGVFPNPVTNGQVVLYFKEGRKGKHTLDLLDISGASKQQSFVNLNGQPQRVSLRTGVLAQGIYLLRISDSEKNEVETIKVLIQ